MTARVGDTAILDGSQSSTTSTQPLSFQWAFASKPDASDAELDNDTAFNPSFVADTAGTYTVELVVSAEDVSSRRAIQLVVVTNPLSVFHQGLSSKCVNCHNDDFGAIPGKSSSHVATSNTCEACHTTLGLAEIPFVDHMEVVGECSECHNGVLAIGKSEFHVPTNVECDACHTTDHFLVLKPDGSFDHSGISRTCIGCHNDTVAIGKTPTPPHPDTDAECGACHTTTSFLGAFPDHNGPEVVGNRCDSCHGVTATGQSDGHPATSVDCGICHDVQTFSLGGDFDHSVIDSVSQPCADCHDGNNSINAIGKTPAPPHPATTEDCAFCHNTQDFADAFIDHSDPVVVAARCDSCHGVTATGKSANHMPTTDDCGVCHTPGTFGSGVFDHAGVVDDCGSCHDGVINTGKPLYHVPTVQDCQFCHTTTAFTPTIFDHSGVTDDCASCHDGTRDEIGAIGLSPNHVPTNEDCSVCHLATDTFAGAAFDHAGIFDECNSCHASGIATGKSVIHVPTADECSVCHLVGDSFLPSTFSHLGITRGCEGCHSSQFFPANPDAVKSEDHLPTDQDCYLCHTTVTFTATVFEHTGISGNCVSCHDGNYIGLGASEAPATPVHVNTTGDCSVCHNTTDFADAFVDHSGPDVVGVRCDSCHNGTDATGKDAKVDHVVTTEDCAVCHVPGTFAPAVFSHDGIVDNCASCHDGNTATGPSVGHVPILPTQDCSVCHNTTAFAGAKFDHQDILDGCAACHDGDIATGKGNNHVPTNADCSDCHVTAGFLPATFDHVGIVENCQSCHDGVFAEGKSNDHVATNEDCGACHNTAGFVPATFDHTGIVDNCASCHGVTATGLSPDHIPTALDCSFCHTTATFAGGIFDHQGISGDCGSCHDGTIAIGKSGDHFDTVQECNACHSTDGWAPIDYTHLVNGDYPGDHNGNVGCISCHEDNDENIAYPTSAYAGTCAGCHANDYEEGPHKHYENPSTKYTVGELQDCAGACHVYDSPSSNTIQKTRNGEHEANDKEF